MAQQTELTLKDLEVVLQISRERQAKRLEDLCMQLQQMKALMAHNTRLQSEMRDTINESRDLRNAPRLEVAPLPPSGETGVFKVTKLARAMFIYNDMACFGNATRNDIIQAFITRLNMTKAGASTYYQQCKDAKQEEAPLPKVIASQVVESLLATI